jgi:mannosyl-glycoprotein endo-beta-N-acetylglucosaminidase
VRELFKRIVVLALVFLILAYPQSIYAINGQEDQTGITTFTTEETISPEDFDFDEEISEENNSLVDEEIAEEKIDSPEEKVPEPEVEELLNGKETQTLEKETQSHSEQGQTITISNASIEVRTANEMLEYARLQPNSSAQLVAYIEGYEQYPNDKRFEVGINDRANSLLNWASGQHDLGNYQSAINRYVLILTAPVLDERIKRAAEKRLDFARQGKLIPTPQDLINIARKAPNSSAHLVAYMDGFDWHPFDIRFEAGINDGARSLLNWATNQHRLENYPTAVIRYELILTAPVLNENIKLETETNLAHALQRTRTADMLFEFARNEPNLSAQLIAFINGYELYPSDKRFEEGVNDRALSLRDWATGQQQNGNYRSAIIRYELILTAPILDEKIKIAVEKRLELARRGLGFLSADDQLNFARKQPTTSAQLLAYIEGYQLYPFDSRFEENINVRASSLLNFAADQHQLGNYQSAILRYELILTAPILQRAIRIETETNLSLAKQRIRTADMQFNFARSQTNSSAQLAAFSEGYNLYPGDKRFEEGVNERALSLLKWASDQHKNGNFSTAIHRYNLIINTPGVENGIVEEARAYLVYAVQGVRLTSKTINYTTFNTTLTNALNTQMGLNPPPQTDQYRTAFIHSSLADKIERGVITGNGVNLRSAPDHTVSNVVVNVPQGTIVVVEAEVRGTSVGGNTLWYRMNYNNQTLFAHSSLVNVTQVGVVKSTATLRHQATTNSHSIGTVSSNTELVIRSSVKGNVVSGSDAWYEVHISYAWRNAAPTDVINYLDPSKQDQYQHLVLTSSIGIFITDAQLNANILNGKGILAGRGKAFIDAGNQFSVNQAYLLAHAILETGHGTSRLATGVYVDRNGNTYRDANGVLITDKNLLPNEAVMVYNMYGIAAFDNNPLNGGARYAFQQGWDTPEKAIIGGAKWISERYIHNPTHHQNTVYKMRWNPNRPGINQYATDMAWASKQLKIMKDVLNLSDAIPLVFDISQYK